MFGLVIQIVSKWFLVVLCLTYLEHIKYYVATQSIILELKNDRWNSTIIVSKFSEIQMLAKTLPSLLNH